MQHKVIIKITDKNFSYLQHLANAVKFINQNLMLDEYCNSIFYQLAIAGEIAAKRLPPDVQKLLPSNICEILRNICDNLLAHSGYTLAVSQAKLLSTLRSYHHQQFGLLSNIINKIIIREATLQICIKLRELAELKDGRFSKANNLVKEIENIFSRIQFSMQALPPQEQEKYTLIQQKFTNNFDFSFTSIKKAISSKIITAVDAARKDDLLRTNIKELENISKAIFAIEELPAEIPEFCHSLVHHFGVLAQKTEMKTITPQILQERKKEILSWIKHYSESLYSITEHLYRFDKQQLINPTQDLEVQITQYDARWHLIMLNALLENVELRSTTLFHTTRNNSIHRFEHIDPKTELDNLEIICREELSPFIRQQEENQTVVADPDSSTLVASDTAISSPSTADTTVATLPVTKKLRLSTDLPSEEKKTSENNLL